MTRTQFENHLFSKAKEMKLWGWWSVPYFDEKFNTATVFRNGPYSGSFLNATVSIDEKSIDNFLLGIWKREPSF